MCSLIGSKEPEIDQTLHVLPGAQLVQVEKIGTVENESDALAPNTNPSINARKRKSNEDYLSRKSIGKVVVDDELFNNIASFVKKNRLRSLTAEERLDILLLQGHIRHRHEGDKEKHRPGRPVKTPQFSRIVAKSLRRDEQLVKSIWSDFIRTGYIDKNVLVAGNRTANCGVIADCRYVTSALLEFVRERQVTRTRTVAKNILDFLCARDS